MKKIFVSTLAAFALVACGTDTATTTSTPSTSTESAASAAEATSKYTNIVAVSSETSDLALQLVGPENMGAISEGSKSPAMGTQTELARQVDKTIPVGTNPDAEQILSYNPDLVLLTARHGGEQSVGDQLQAAGVNVLEYHSEDFDSPESLARTIRNLATEVGVDGEEMAADFEAKIAEIDKRKGEKTPRFTALMARGGTITGMSDDQVMAGLATRAGGENTARGTMPLDAEMLVKMNPEIIFVEDFMGQGMEPFQALLENPALAEVPAVKNNRIVLLPMTEASAVAGVNMTEGYAKIMDEIGA